jgi:hypothetical protein
MKSQGSVPNGHVKTCMLTGAVAPGAAVPRRGTEPEGIKVGSGDLRQ